MKQKRYNVTVSSTKEVNLSSVELSDFAKKVGLDLGFQSEARWPDSQKSEYMTSVIIGMAPSKIVVANIENCLDSLSESNSEDSDDYSYFDSWYSQGKNYISVDGNNRTKTIYEYLQGKVTLQHGEYLLPSGPVKIDSTNDRYNTHPSKLKEYITKHIFISICEYSVATRSDLSDLFKNINNGVPLNAQELRNATLVQFAADIRELVEQYRGAFKTIKKNNNRRVIDEQFVNLSVYYAFEASHGISKADKDGAYEDNSTVSKMFIKGGRKVIEDTMKMVSKYADAGFKDVSTLMNLFIAMVELHKQNRTINDKQKFFEWFMSTENARIGNNKHLAQTKEGESRTYAGCNKSTSNIFLQARYEYIVKDLKSVPSDIVATFDPERLFTETQRFKLWKKQNGSCPRTGKKIPQHEINNHELWHADHVIPYSKGGPTTLDNGELVCKDYNLSKSSKMPELMAA